MTSFPVAPGRVGRTLAAALTLVTLAPAAARAQARNHGAVIDTIVIERQDLFPPTEAAESPFLSLFNQLHGVTRPFVIRRELLFEPGTTYDSALVAESERNLRALGLFRSVRLDTVRVGDRLEARVRTRDAWSLLPRVNARIASDGTLTGSVGLTETNVAGTGNRLRLWYVREADRDGIVASGSIPRFGRGQVGAGASWASLSDLHAGSWSLASRFRSFSDRWSVFYGGELFRGRVFQYRTFGPGARDTTEWRRRALINRGYVTYAPVATPERYLRVGLTVEVRREEYLELENRALDPDSVFAGVPDTVYGMAAVYAEYRRARFQRVTRFNGFTEEDQDLSDLVFVTLRVAPGGLGYRSTGIGGRVLVGSGVRVGPAILKGSVDANALWSSAGLDSGRVTASGTVAVRSGTRQATFLQVSGGVLERPPPGGEFDLGFEVLPRLWGPHAFVGTRSLRGTLEHRVFVWDDILSIVGGGFAAFVDYGGAWYAGQDARFGGNAGLSMFFGSPLGSLAQVVHLSGGYRFGGGIGDTDSSRWAVSLGSGIIF